MTRTPKHPRWQRVAAALATGVVAGLISAQFMRPVAARAEGGPFTWLDFEYWWLGARAVVAGLDPYTAVGPGAALDVPSYFVYPLPAAVLSAPLTLLPLHQAAALFVAIGFALAAYVLSARGWHHLLALGSAPALYAVESAQWSPYLLAATLLPPLSALLIVKPHLAVALAAYRPTWWLIGGGAGLSAVTFALQPMWPLDWLSAVQRFPDVGQYAAPAAIGPGALGLLAILRWRRPEARVLFLLTCVPQNFYWYDQVLLFLIPATLWEVVTLCMGSHLIRAVVLITMMPGQGQVGMSLAYAPYLVWGMYLPCLIMLLRRPNEGPAPAWLERAVGRAPQWLRGQPEAA